MTGKITRGGKEVKYIFRNGHQLMKIQKGDGRYIEFDPIPAIWFTPANSGASVSLITVGSPNAAEFVYSRDGVNWSDYTLGETINLPKLSDIVFFRAKSTNSGMSSSAEDYYQFKANNVYCDGELMTLLDNTGKATDVPRYCFCRLFSENSTLYSLPKISALTSASFAFAYYAMDCRKLNKPSVIKITNIPTACFLWAFYGTGIKLSETKTGEYQQPYRIPESGTGIVGTYSLDNMFLETQGTFTDTPEVNKTYYGAW